MTTNKSPGKKEGGLDLNADSVEISGSDIAGRDHIEGITGEELKQIIETLLKYFPKSYLQNPEELDKTLNDLRRYHEQLREYKELHNKINRILIAFEPFKQEMNRLKSMRGLPDFEYLITLWYRVSLEVEELLKWSETIEYIGNPVRSVEENKKEGVSWAIKFSDILDELNHLGLRGHSEQNKEYFDTNPKSYYQRSKNKLLSLKALVECTSRFNDTASTYMDIADEQLRQTAQELLNLSSKALSRY